MPICVDALNPYDYHLYIFAHRSDWLVIVEADYLFMNAIPQDIANSFDLTVKGWYRRKNKEESYAELLPESSFKNDDSNEWSDVEWDNYEKAVYSEYGMKYAVLRVEPKQSITPNSFPLSFFNQLQKYDEPEP